jgi:hypothetical protein
VTFLVSDDGWEKMGGYRPLHQWGVLTLRADDLVLTIGAAAVHFWLRRNGLPAQA